MNKQQTVINYRERADKLIRWARLHRANNPMLAFCAFVWSQRLIVMARNVESMPAGEFYRQRYTWQVSKQASQSNNNGQLSLF